MKVIVINGPMGVGKTTVGKIIAERNPGTAFIDGDWCMDLHPFTGNYQKCSVCGMVVLAWLMDDEWVRRGIAEGIAALGAEVKETVLICDRESLIRRWKNDRKCEWRTDEWLNASLKSLPVFAAMSGLTCTGGLTAEQAADLVMEKNR